MLLRIVFDSWQIESNLAIGLVGDMLCLARLRSAISFASLFGVPGPNLIGLGGALRDSLGGLVLNLEGGDDTSSRRRVGLVGVEWRSCEGIVEVVPQELVFSGFYRCLGVHGQDSITNNSQ